MSADREPRIELAIAIVGAVVAGIAILASIRFGWMAISDKIAKSYFPSPRYDEVEKVAFEHRYNASSTVAHQRVCYNIQVGFRKWKNAPKEASEGDLLRRRKMATVTIEKSDLEKLKEFTNNTMWLLQNVDALRGKYPDRFVAVFDSGNLILDAPTKEELIAKILGQGRKPEVSAIEFVTREPYLLIV